MILDFRFQ